MIYFWRLSDVLLLTQIFLWIGLHAAKFAFFFHNLWVFLIQHLLLSGDVVLWENLSIILFQLHVYVVICTFSNLYYFFIFIFTIDRFAPSSKPSILYTRDHVKLQLIFSTKRSFGLNHFLLQSDFELFDKDRLILG